LSSDGKRWPDFPHARGTGPVASGRNILRNAPTASGETLPLALSRRKSAGTLVRGGRRCQIGCCTRPDVPAGT